MRLWLIRHAEAAAAPGVAVGWSDPPLSEPGERRARELAAELAATELTAVYSSDLRRALRTAELIAAPHGLAVLAAPELRELDFGAWEGRALGELWTEEPESATAWERDLRQTPPSFGETVAELEERVRRFAGGPLAGGRGPIAIVGHHGSLAALRTVLTGCGFAAAWASPCVPGVAVPLDLEVARCSR